MGTKAFMLAVKKIGKKRICADLECLAIDLAIYPLPLSFHNATWLHLHTQANQKTKDIIIIQLFLYVMIYLQGY